MQGIIMQILLRGHLVYGKDYFSFSSLIFRISNFNIPISWAKFLVLSESFEMIIENSISIIKIASRNIKNNAAGGYATPISWAKYSSPSLQIEKTRKIIQKNSHSI